MRRMLWHVALVPEGSVIRYALPQRAFAQSAEGDWQLQHGVELVIKHRICCHYTIISKVVFCLSSCSI